MCPVHCGERDTSAHAAMCPRTDRAREVGLLSLVRETGRAVDDVWTRLARMPAASVFEDYLLQASPTGDFVLSHGLTGAQARVEVLRSPRGSGPSAFFSPEDFVRLRGMWDSSAVAARRSGCLRVALLALSDYLVCDKVEVERNGGAAPESLVRWQKVCLGIDGAAFSGAQNASPHHGHNCSARKGDVDFGCVYDGRILDLDKCFWTQNPPGGARRTLVDRAAPSPVLARMLQDNVKVLTWPTAARVTALIPYKKGLVIGDLAKACGATILFTVLPGQFSFQPGLQWNGGGHKATPCSSAVALFLWESPAARAFSPWHEMSQVLLLEWARTALADGISGIVVPAGVFSPSAVASSDYLLSWHGCPLTEVVLPPVGPQVPHPFANVVQEQSAGAALLEWPVQAWYFGIFPATLPGSSRCALLHGSAGFKLRAPFLRAWWRIWARVDSKLRPAPLDKPAAAVARDTRCGRMMERLGVTVSDVWPAARPWRWSGSQHFGSLDISG